jgi:flagellar assembly factor FliW
MVKVEAMDMAVVTTTRFGTVEFDRDKVIDFVEDIPGFPEAKRFIFIPHADDSPLNWLQCIDAPELAFAVLDPWLLFDDYKPALSGFDLESLDLGDNLDEDLIILSVLTIPSDPQMMTVNLKAPIVINAKLNKAKQVVLSNDEYLIKQPIPQSR